MTSGPTRPVPVPDATSSPFWEATAQGRLALARCGRCHRFVHPPEPVCPACGSTDPAFAFEPVAGTGQVRSWTVLRRAFLPGFADDLPIVLVDVALDLDGARSPRDVRLVGRLLDGPGVPLAVGDAVVAAFEDVAEDVAVPAFRLAPT